MASVLRWCGFPGICTLRYSPEHPGCGVHKCGVCGESGTNSTRECFLILFADAVNKGVTAKESEISRWLVSPAKRALKKIDIGQFLDGKSHIRPHTQNK